MKICLTVLLLLISFNNLFAPTHNFKIKEKEKELKINTKYIGDKYVWGGTKDNKFDCSGLIYRIYKDNNISIKRHTVYSFNKTFETVPDSNIQIGDILIFNKHCALYLGDNKFIHSTCSKGVRIDSIGSYLWEHYYKYRYKRVKRINKNHDFFKLTFVN